MSQDADKRAILVWVESCFAGKLPRPCTELADLGDGVLLSAILHEIAPAFFDTSDEDDNCSGSGGGVGGGGEGNWALRLSTLKNVARNLDEYYATQLGKAISNLDTIDLAAIAKMQDSDEILSLMELVIGAAVMCEDKARFIQKIFSLDAPSQLALKGIIEQCMARVADAERESSSSNGDGASDAADAQAVIAELQQVVTHLHQERQRLLEQASTGTQTSAGLQRDNEALSLRVAELEREREASDGSDRYRSSVAASLTDSLRHELDDCKHDLDLKTVETDDLRAAVKTLEQRVAASKELQAKLEMENAQIGDELDVLRDKATRLTRAETAADKYAKKLEELPALRKENKELLARLDEYLDKIQELEAASKAGATMQRLVEQYKDKAVEMEREKFEALSARQMQQHEMVRLVQEAEDAQEARRFLEEELSAARAELEQHMGEGEGSKVRSSTSSFHGEGDLYDTETMATLHEKLKLAERELRTLRAGGRGGRPGESASGPAVAADAPTAAQLSYEDLLQRDVAVVVQELALCRAELEDAMRAKREREESLIALRKQLAEAQAEMQRTHRLLTDGEGRVGKSNKADKTEGDKAESAKADKAALKESEARVAQANNTLRLLEERLREKETSIAALEQDRDRLETFSRSQLAAFKDKFLAALEQGKEERRVLQAKLAASEQRSEKHQATARAEQCLVMSAVYELGAKIMDRNLLGLPVGGGGVAGGAGTDGRKRGQGTFLGIQTAAQLRALDNQLLSGVVAGGGSLPGTPGTPYR